ncbi:MepB family protein [Flavobacterium sp. SUN052]|uniref:MepB family protein n=1 Tax=Flavobacterium sp. SUN052 TaxID=3002441 RepID=UPI00237ECF80|nr:MepB family protein [Flavobacterium sp. SUN052]MEC4005527.1 MepB family protein [Flavobacterium sp. SUN052]
MTHQKLEETSKLVFEKLDLKLQNLVIEKESEDYYAAQFKLNDLKIVFREAKITPTKIGQFVTLWKRIDKKPIQPLEVTDDFDFVIINAKTSINFGQFVFPKKILEQKGYLKSQSKIGKLGFRIYPSWDKTTNKQAKQTQKWQLDYFIETPINLSKAKALYSTNQ